MVGFTLRGVNATSIVAFYIESRCEKHVALTKLGACVSFNDADMHEFRNASQIKGMNLSFTLEKNSAAAGPASNTKNPVLK